MNIINLSIDTSAGVKTIDLFPNETISLTSNIQNIKDVSKVFTDFTQPFTVPASANNNETFKHYYNVSVTNGFNAKRALNSLIEINQLPYKKGKLKLLGVNMANGVVESYRLTFIGQLKNLSDTLGEDTLNVLNLSDLNHLASYNAISPLITGSGDIVYPLITSKKNWEWNTQGTSLAADDIRYSTGNSNGISVGELKPAIKVNKILSAIQSKYGLTFSNDFFNTSTHFNDLYIYANRELSTSDASDALKYRLMNIDGQNGLFPWVLEVDRDVSPSKTYWKVEFTLTITPVDNTPYSIRINGDTEISHTGTLVHTWTESVLSTLERDGTSTIQPRSGDVKIEWKTDGSLTFDATLVKTRTFSYPRTNWGTSSFPEYTTYSELGITTTSDTIIVSNGSEGSGILPNIKIIDFLNGLIKMFNLVIEPITDTSFRIQTLNDWYANGADNDITTYLNRDYTVDRPSLPGKISFKYEKSNTISGKKQFEQHGKGYGDIEIDNLGFDGPNLEIKLPFENVVGDTLTDRVTNQVTDIFTVKLIDVDNDGKSKTVATKPILLYRAGLYTPNSGPISILNDSGARVGLSTYNIFKNTNNTDNALINQSLNFGDEVDTFTKNGLSFLEPPKNPYSPTSLKYSLYSNYWEDYIRDLYDETRRVYSYSGNLPIHKLISVKLNDKIIINDTKYIINDYTTNLTTGDIKLELLNDIYVNGEDASVLAVINATDSRLTCNNPTISLSGINSKGINRTYLWTTPDGTIDTSATLSSIVVSAAGTYTLTVTDENLLQDTHAYTISDYRTTPTVTITPSVFELTAASPSASISSSLDSGYAYQWTTDTGSIISGENTNEIWVDAAGTYTLLATQNNTGCIAGDEVIITGGDLDLPTIPVGLFVLNSTTSSINLVWSPSTDSHGIQNYDVFVNDVYYTSSLVENQTITGLTENYIYKLNVVARDNSDNESAQSESLYGIARLFSNGIDGLTVAVSNEAHTLPTTAAGIVTYTGSGTTISLYEGSNALSYDATGSNAGTWKVVATPTNITVGAATDDGTYVTYGEHDNMIANTASISYLITGKRANGDAISITKIQSFAKSIAGTDGADGVDGSSGTNAKVVVLNSDKYVITYNSSGVETPSGQVMNLTATQQNHVGTVYYEFKRETVSKQNTTSSTYTILDADEPVGNAVVGYSVITREGSSVGTVVATDTISVFGIQDAADGVNGFDGTDGMTCIVTNEAHTLAANAAGTVSSYVGSGTNIYLFEGTTALQYVNTLSPFAGYWTVAMTPTSITGGTRTDYGTYVTIGNHSAMTADNASILYTISGYRSDGSPFSLTKTQSFSKSKAGADGADGADGTNGVDASKSTTGYVYYQTAQDTAPTTPSASSYNFSTYAFTGLTGGWSKTPPVATGGGKYWVSVYNVTETTPLGGTGVPTFTSPSNSLQFTDIVTFTDLSTSQPTTTIINGNNITTGIIKSANYTTGTAPYSAAGTQINLSDGVITSKNFGIDSSGNAFFKGAVAGGTIDIGGADTSSFHVDNAGNMWTGASTFASATFSVSATGAVKSNSSFTLPSYMQTIDGIDAGVSQSGGDVIWNKYGGGILGTMRGYTSRYYSSGYPDTSYKNGIVITATDTFSVGKYSTTDGWFYYDNNVGTTGRFFVYGDIAATGNITAYFSDERLKNNLGNIENPLDKIKLLNGFRYTNNDIAKELGAKSQEIQIGVSAQEVQKVLPEIVYRAPIDIDKHSDKSKSGENYLTVDYDKLVPLLIEGIKELTDKVKQLEGEVKKLKG